MIFPVRTYDLFRLVDVSINIKKIINLYNSLYKPGIRYLIRCIGDLEYFYYKFQFFIVNLD